MKAPQDIIIAPVITEKSMAGIATKKYTFQGLLATLTRLRCQGNRVPVPWHQGCKVNTMNVAGKAKRMGMNQGYRSDWKKAIVTLAEGSNGIEFFETML